jgi:hypothetical protein
VYLHGGSGSSQVFREIAADQLLELGHQDNTRAQSILPEKQTIVRPISLVFQDTANPRPRQARADRLTTSRKLNVLTLNFIDLPLWTDPSIGSADRRRSPAMPEQ